MGSPYRLLNASQPFLLLLYRRDQSEDIPLPNQTFEAMKSEGEREEKKEVR